MRSSTFSFATLATASAVISSLTGMTSFSAAWDRLCRRLDAGLPDWKGRIESWGQVRAVEARARGEALSDELVFRGIVLSVLSNNTNWERVECVRGELDALFDGYRPTSYAILSPEDIDGRFLPWFKARRAGSMTLRARLKDLIVAANKLLQRARPHGSLDSYLASLFTEAGRDPKQLTFVLAAGANKLDGIGPALAAEALKNIGYDVAKPDRHVNRAVGSLGWVRFAKWGAGDPLRYAAPEPKRAELEAVLMVMEQFATKVGERIALVDNAMWLLCAASGLHLTNAEVQDCIGVTTSS